MCGIKSKLFLVILVLSFLVSLPVYSEQRYYITESQLQRMEQIQAEQQETIEKQKQHENELNQELENLKLLQESLNQDVKNLEKSYQTSETINKFLKIAIPVCSAICFGGGLYLGYTLSR